MAKAGVIEFFKQVRQETSKVTWIARKELLVTTGVVLVMVLIASVFFLMVDSVINNITKAIMGL